MFLFFLFVFLKRFLRSYRSLNGSYGNPEVKLITLIDIEACTIGIMIMNSALMRPYLRAELTARPSIWKLKLQICSCVVFSPDWNLITIGPIMGSQYTFYCYNYTLHVQIFLICPQILCYLYNLFNSIWSCNLLFYMLEFYVLDKIKDHDWKMFTGNH